MADDFFGPASDLAVTTRPVLSPQTPRAGHAPTFFKRCSSEGADDGTMVDAEWLNHLVANLDRVRTRAGLGPSDVAPASDDILVESIIALIDQFGGGGSGLTMEEIRDEVANNLLQVTGGLLFKEVDDLGNKVRIGLSSGLFVAPGVLLSMRVYQSSGTWAPDDAARSAVVLACGAGGAGGGVPNPGTGTAGAGGGGGEARLLFLSSLAESYQVVIGAGGAGRTNAAGGAGGATQIRRGEAVILRCGGGGGGSTWSVNIAGAAGSGGAGGLSLGATAGSRTDKGDPDGGGGGGNFFGPGAPLSPVRMNGQPGSTWGAGGAGANGWNNTGGAISGVGGAGKGGLALIFEFR